MALTTYLANKLLDHAVGKTAYSMPTVYVGLTTANPTNSGAFTNEAVWTGYGRVAVPGTSWNAAASGADATSASISFGAKTGGADQTVTYLFTADAVTSGNMLEFFPLGTSQTISNGNTPSLAAGSFSRTAA